MGEIATKKRTFCYLLRKAVYHGESQPEMSAEKKYFRVNFVVKTAVMQQEEIRNGKTRRKYQKTERWQVGRAL